MNIDWWDVLWWVRTVALGVASVAAAAFVLTFLAAYVIQPAVCAAYHVMPNGIGYGQCLDEVFK